MDEVDENSQVGHHQPQSHRDADMWHEVPMRSRADRHEHKHGIDKGRHEGAERQLGPAVADEIPQHTGPELSGRQGQRHQDDREDDTYDGDHGGGDRRQDLAGGVGRPANHPRRDRERTPICGPVEQQRAREECDSGNDLDRGNEPQAGAEHLAAPVGGKR
jgi:hypothetical protein